MSNAEEHADTAAESKVVRLPHSQRPTATAPGHWVLARAGKKVLRPGGAALSHMMLRRAAIPGADVVEFAPGLGRTAAVIVSAGPASYIGVDQDPDAARIVGTVVAPVGGSVRQGDASDTGLPDGCADVVIGEAMLTMQGDAGKRAIIAEAARLLRPGGRYAIHELAVTPDSIEAEEHLRIRRELARAIHVNARPMTRAQWVAFLEEAGLEVEWSDTAPMALLRPSRVIKDEGFAGALRIMRNVLRDRELRARVKSMAGTFRRNERHMCGVALIARKPDNGEGRAGDIAVKENCDD
ncbi:class I SAM-dependent methyltransferase [Schaalia suimastitidis]|uniref:class I SAM-dependent methyltransferase n=1 Tax=Schaalia suimastitidis TaxID=121163 RepID=UPI0006887D9A|nr:class I SAM-dependent methyltransferase [Schaalia suimastitidis]